MKNIFQTVILRAWIGILDAPGCYECAARVEKVRTTRLRIGQNCRPCAQRRVALMPWAIATARDAFCRSNDRRESAMRLERPAC